jgi:hypothetical protein
LRWQRNPTNAISMKPDPLEMKILLRKREGELQKIIRQMKQDNLHSSPVYKNLEQELETLKSHLTDPSQKQ